MDRDTRILDRNGLTEAAYLQSYDPGRYERPSVAADMAIFTVLEETEDNYRKLPEKELGILLIQRGVHPYLGSWALPGGFVRPDETTEQAARRELMEENRSGPKVWNSCMAFSDLAMTRTWP